MTISRDKYKQYKMLYKKYLKQPDAPNLSTQLHTLEEQLDVSNIVMAREHAKLEVRKTFLSYRFVKIVLMRKNSKI